MAEKFQWYRGVKFTRDDKTGYYLNSTMRIRMHRFVWLCERGEIPNGYDVHHIDHDKSNNDISNLELLSEAEHSRLHYEEKSDEEKQKQIDIMNQKARPKAIEWHKSKIGRKWHSEMVKHAWADGKLGKKETFICEQCGKEFQRIYKPGHKFCSGACEQKYLRAHEPTETRICVICGKEFTCKKSSGAKTCSKSCSRILGHRTRNIKDK